MPPNFPLPSTKTCQHTSVLFLSRMATVSGDDSSSNLSNAKFWRHSGLQSKYWIYSTILRNIWLFEIYQLTEIFEFWKSHQLFEIFDFSRSRQLSEISDLSRNHQLSEIFDFSISRQLSENLEKNDESPFELNLSVGVAYLGGHFGSFGSAQNDSGIGQ